jgi:hypothetical protein
MLETDAFRNTAFRPMKFHRRVDAESADHRRLRRRLEGWADSLGFANLATDRCRGLRPDVVRSDESGKWLFLGDAAMADHEHPAAPGVPERIAACTAEFVFLLRTEQITGGRIAVATNCEEAAASWAERMGAVMEALGLVEPDGTHPGFQVKRISPKTWVAFW